MTPEDATATAAGEGLVVVLATFPDAELAARVAHLLVAERRVACVNILPAVRSVYAWKGQVESAAEVLVIMKTRAGAVNDVVARVKALHPYELPEVIALPVVAGLPGYVQWIMDETQIPASTESTKGPTS